jgi:hypothetical protein
MSSMTERQQASFESWAIVDVLGHQRYVGYVTTEAYGQAVLFRIDVPALEARERVTKRPGNVDGRYLPAGSTVQEGAVAGYTKLIGSGSIYAITPCTKEAALEAVEQAQPRPLMNVALPPDRALEGGTPMRDPDDPAHRSYDDPEDPDDDDPDDDDEDELDDEELARLHGAGESED